MKFLFSIIVDNSFILCELLDFIFRLSNLPNLKAANDSRNLLSFQHSLEIFRNLFFSKEHAVSKLSIFVNRRFFKQNSVAIDGTGGSYLSR